MQSFLSCCERLHAHRADDQRWPGDSHSRVQAGATRGLGKARQATHGSRSPAFSLTRHTKEEKMVLSETLARSFRVSLPDGIPAGRRIPTRPCLPARSLGTRPPPWWKGLHRCGPSTDLGVAGICRGSRGHNLEDGGAVWPREEPVLSQCKGCGVRRAQGRLATCQDPCSSRGENPLSLWKLRCGSRASAGGRGRVTEGHPLSSRPPTEELAASSQYLLGSI